MDNQSIGKLILQLRREYGMTQAALAARLHISDRTVSKWERGAGCPDISLIHALSGLFGVQAEALLSGNLTQKDTNGGNMRKIKFYLCPTCGNALFAMDEAEISCCGRRLQPLHAHSGDEAHDVTAEDMDGETYISLNHEMTKAHFITFAAQVTYDRVLFVKLYPEQSAEVRFPKKRGCTLFFCCTEHGLIKMKPGTLGSL